jgi:hypothetical protein
MYILFLFHQVFVLVQEILMHSTTMIFGNKVTVNKRSMTCTGFILTTLVLCSLYIMGLYNFLQVSLKLKYLEIIS